MLRLPQNPFRLIFRACVCVCVCVVLLSREDHLHRNQCFAGDRPAWLGGPGQEVHLRFLSAARQRTLPRQEAAAWGWVEHDFNFLASLPKKKSLMRSLRRQLCHGYQVSAPPQYRYNRLNWILNFMSHLLTKLLPVERFFILYHKVIVNIITSDIKWCSNSLKGRQDIIVLDYHL